MKKYLFIGLMAVLATSCEKDPDLSKLDNNFTVYTNYDSKTNFNDFKTYCLPDSILLIGQGMKAEFWKDENAQEIIKQVADEMDTRGYTRVKVIKNANIGLQLSFTRQTTQIIGTGGWYGGGWYNGWWGPGYWGPYWNDWYYPYPVTYEFLSSCLCLLFLKTGKYAVAHLLCKLRRCKIVQDKHLIRSVKLKLGRSVGLVLDAADLFLRNAGKQQAQVIVVHSHAADNDALYALIV